MKYFCNPVNIPYRYQFHEHQEKDGKYLINRESADPSITYFKGKYYLFGSMSLGVYVSEDLVTWEYHRLSDEMPLYDYAPDVEVIGDFVYICASRADGICNFYRTQDIEEGPWEEIEGTFPFWDPALFADDDGRLYLYWGASNCEPIYGVELDPKTMKPMGEKTPLIWGKEKEIGYERFGENHVITEENGAPYMEGAWMTKYNGKYYLQYACPATEFSIYADGVYESDSPLGPFTLANNNPYSYYPGGYMTGAGHGSTFVSPDGKWYHAATMHISANENYERRVGIWNAGFDKDGELYCNQAYGGWPIAVPEEGEKTTQHPLGYLLSYGKKATASSCTPGREPEFAVDEKADTWWRAAEDDKNAFLLLDLGKQMDIRAIQINFADDWWEPLPANGEIHTWSPCKRYIDDSAHVTRWKLEGSLDGKEFFLIEDKTEVMTDLSHDFLVRETGMDVQYLRLTVIELPFGQPACVSGLRVFGFGGGEKPGKVQFEAKRTGSMNMEINMKAENAEGFMIFWGSSPDKLYHSCMTYETTRDIGALVAGRETWVKVDAFNDSGIQEGPVLCLD